MAIGNGKLLLIMCGICGFTGMEDRNVLGRMTGSLLHRGPDEGGYYSDGKAHLGIRRLSIIDVETGHQPVHNEDETVWAVFNGEIYNFKELRGDLGRRGHRFYTDHSDSELLVHLYEEFGYDFTNLLNGMFAIALWDKNEEKLLLVRDRMGVKPLFYALVKGRIIFGSEIKAILVHPDYSGEMNEEAIYHYFTFKNIPAPLTAFKGISSLLPGERLVFSRGRVHRERWWKIRFQENPDIEESEIKRTLLALLENATELRMRSDVPFGAYLSGGVDSSTVVALMSRFSNQPVKTFSLGYQDELKNKEADLHYARKVAQIFKTDHYEYTMSSRELLNEIESVLRSFDQPFSGTISTYFLSKLIRQHVKVALSGDAADELFGSYLSHRVAQPMYHFKRLYQKVTTGKLKEEESALFYPFDIDFLNELFIKSNGEPPKWKHHLAVFNDQEKDQLFSEDFKCKVNGISSLSLLESYFNGGTTRDPLNSILEIEWNTQLPDQVLSFVDFLSMAHSVEVRSPFLDYRLVEFAATLPGTIKIKNGNVKDILKQTVKDLIPQEITQRPKEGFVLPIFDWMTENLKEFSLDVLSDKRLNSHRIFDSERVQHILAEYHRGQKSFAAKVWNLMMFQIWWEIYFE